MASTLIPGQSQRWGNESTNFYQASYTSNPGVASRQKVYRCADHQYTNSGHYHVGTKTVPSKQPLDRYGTPGAYKLRLEDQRLPRALATPHVHEKRMAPDRPVNLYQSHQYHHNNYAMTKPSLPLATTQQPPLNTHGSGVIVTRNTNDKEELARSLSKAFYITSYQSDTAHAAVGKARSITDGSLCEQLTARSMALQEANTAGPNSTVLVENKPPPSLRYRVRVPSAPVTRQHHHHPTTMTTATGSTQPPHSTGTQAAQSLLPQRRRSFSAVQRSFPSRGDMLKEIFGAFPTPQPQQVNRWKARPSSAVEIRTGRIPKLRDGKAWI